MTVRLKIGTYLRLFQVFKDAFPCRVVSEGESYVMIHNKNLSPANGLKQSHMDGPVEIQGTKLDLSLYATGVEASNACLWVNGPVSGPGMLLNATRGHIRLTGTNTHVLGSVRQTSYGDIVLQDPSLSYLKTTLKTFYSQNTFLFVFITSSYTYPVHP